VAQQFADRYADHLRYCHDTGAWFRWDGNIWRQVRTGIAFQWARGLARSMAVCEPAKIRYTTSKISFAGGVERFARSDPVFAVTMDVFGHRPLASRHTGRDGGFANRRAETCAARRTDNQSHGSGACGNGKLSHLVALPRRGNEERRRVNALLATMGRV
jgi:D5 N terminal like